MLVLVISGGIRLGNAQSSTFLPDNLQPITPANMHSIEQLAMLGTGTIESIAWSSNSQQIAAAGSAGIRLFDVNTLDAAPVWFSGHIGKTNDVVFSGDGSLLLSVGEDGMMRQWSVDTGEQILTACPQVDGEPCLISGYYSIALSPDEQAMALGLTNGMSVITASLSEELFGSVGEAGFEVQFSADGRLLASTGFRDGDVSIWNVNGTTFELLRDIAVPFEIWDFAFSPEGNAIALASFWSREVPGVQVFDSRTGEQLIQFDGGYSVSIDPTGRMLATLDTRIVDEQPTSFVTIWSLETGEMLSALPTPSGISQIRFSPDGTKLAAGYVDGGIAVWEIPSYTLHGMVEGRGAAVRSIALLNDQLISLDGLGFDISTPLGGGTAEGDTLRLWDLVSGQELQSWRGEELDPALTAIGTLAHIPNTTQFILRRENSPFFYAWSLGENTVIPFDSPTPYLDRQIVFSHAGNRMAVFGDDRDFQGKTIYLWDIIHNPDGLSFDLGNAIPAVFPETEQDLDLIALHPTAPEIVGLTFDGHIKLWDAESGELMQVGSLGGRRSILSATYSPDGTLLIINDGFLRLFNANTLEELDTLTSWDIVSYYGRLEFNQGGSLVTSIINSYGYGGGIALWDMIDEVEPRILPAKATSILFSSDDRLLISAGYDGTIRFWGVRSR